MKHVFNVYFGTEQFFSNKVNYIEFGYDWRRGIRSAAGYLRTFLQMIRDKVIKRGYANPLSGLTLFAHSLGGLVVKLFLNELVDDEENTQEWFYRFVSIATSYYGTENHIERYYVGDNLINALAGGAKRVAFFIASMPSFLSIMPAPKYILQPRYDSLGLDEHPVRDADNPDLELDPYSPDNQERCPPILNGRYLNDAKTTLAQVDRELPDSVKERTFHICNKLPSRSEYPLKLYWENVVTEDYNYDGPSPIKNDGGESDGTTPFWSARLASTPNDHVYSIEISTEHEYLASAPIVLHIVNRLSHGCGFRQFLSKLRGMELFNNKSRGYR